MYHDDGFTGQISRKLLYGPNDLNDKMITVANSSHKTNKQLYAMNRELNKSNLYQVRLSLRRLANYRFILYFLLLNILLKFLTGWPIMLTVLFVSFCYLLHTIIASN